MTSDATGWKRSAAQMGIILTGMSHLASQTISYGLLGLPFNDEALAEIKAKSVRHLKNMDVVGLQIEDEAELLREAIENFDKLADSAITQGRKIAEM
jgi:hypothetical protein